MMQLPEPSPEKIPTPPLPILSIDEAVKVKKPSRPRLLADYVPFPLDALAAPAAAFVREASTSLCCDPAFVALPALAVQGAAIGNARRIRLKRKWTEPSVIWSAVIASSGSQKSPAIEMATQRFDELDDEAQRAYQRDVRGFNQRMDLYKIDLKKARMAGLEIPDKPAPPPNKRLLCDDVTVETVAEFLGDNPRGILTACDELAGWFAGFCRYSNSSTMPSWLRMHRASAWRYDRAKVDPITGEKRRIAVRMAHVCITGMITHGGIKEALTPQARDLGLASRLLLAMPPRRPKTWDVPDIDPDVDKNYQATIDRLLHLDSEQRDGQPYPILLKLTPEAHERWRDFYNQWAARQMEAFGAMASMLAKLEAYAARFALIHHVTQCAFQGSDDKNGVPVESIEAGVKLCEWFAQEMARVYDMLDERPDDSRTRTLFEYIRDRGGRVNVSTMRQRLRYRDADGLREALEPLLNGGLIHYVTEPAQRPGGGGRPTEFVELIGEQIIADAGEAAADGEIDDAGELTDAWFERTTRLRDGKPWENRDEVRAGMENLLGLRFTKAFLLEQIHGPRDRDEWFATFRDRIKSGRAVPTRPITAVETAEERAARIESERAERGRVEREAEAVREQIRTGEIMGMRDRFRVGGRLSGGIGTMPDDEKPAPPADPEQPKSE